MTEVKVGYVKENMEEFMLQESKNQRFIMKIICEVHGGGGGNERPGGESQSRQQAATDLTSHTIEKRMI
jgi:hypothetical protein